MDLNLPISLTRQTFKIDKIIIDSLDKTDSFDET